MVPLTRRERHVVAALAFAVLAWIALPAITQPQGYHHFADARPFAGIPNAADVLSNLAFVAVGLVGLWRLARTALALNPAQRVSLAVLFAGFVLTGFGSGYYHWAPSDDTLFWDRLPMTIVFAGVFGAMLAGRVSERAGLAVLLVMVVTGPLTVVAWRVSGDLSPYAVVQFGGMLGVVALLLLVPRGDDPFDWWRLIAWYAASKAFEAADALVWTWTGGIVAGHALKHLAAAAAGLAIARGLAPAGDSRKVLAPR